jgi:hypothetical protein
MFKFDTMWSSILLLILTYAVASINAHWFGPSTHGSAKVSSYTGPSNDTIYAAQTDATCQELYAKYPDLTFLPKSDSYLTEVTREFLDLKTVNIR